MMSELGKEKYFDANGNFNLAAYSFDRNKELMKFCLDQGNMAISDNRKLRSYKERIKKEFYDAWFELAGILESLGIIEPCGCNPREKCPICRGSRYRLGAMLSPEEMGEICSFTSAPDPEVAQKLLDKLPEAEMELARLREGNTARRENGGQPEERE